MATDLEKFLAQSPVRRSPAIRTPSVKRHRLKLPSSRERKLTALQRVAAAPVARKKQGIISKTLDVLTLPFQLEEKGVVRLLSGNKHDTYTEWFKALGAPKIVAGAGGFAASILGVPSTYLGGAAIKGVARAVGGGAKVLHAAEPVLAAAAKGRKFGKLTKADKLVLLAEATEKAKKVNIRRINIEIRETTKKKMEALSGLSDMLKLAEKAKVKRTGQVLRRYQRTWQELRPKQTVFGVKVTVDNANAIREILRAEPKRLAQITRALKTQQKISVIRINRSMALERARKIHESTKQAIEAGKLSVIKQAGVVRGALRAEKVAEASKVRDVHGRLVRAQAAEDIREGFRPSLKAASEVEKIINFNEVYRTVAKTMGVKELSKSSKVAIKIAARMDPSTRARFVSMGRAFARFWLPMITLPKGKAYEVVKGEFLGTLSKHESKIDAIFKILKKQSKETREAMFNFLDGKALITAVPKTMQAMALSLRNINNQLGQEFVKRGLLSQATIDKHKNKYIRYLYTYHLLGKTEKATASGMKLGLRNTMRRSETLTDAERAAKGFIKDVAVAQPFGMAESLGDISKFDFMETISKNKEWVWGGAFTKVVDEVGRMRKWTLGDLQEHVAALRKSNSSLLPKYAKALDRLENAAGKAGSDYVQLGTAKGYGPLSGAMVRREIADDIMPMVEGIAIRKNMPGLVATAAGLQRTALAWFKMLKVAGNPPTAIRNTLSNPWQMFLGGVPIRSFPKLMVETGGHFKGKTKMWQEASSQGLFKTDFVSAEIDDIIKVSRNLPAGSVTEWIKNMPNYIRGLAGYYGKIDDWYKMATYTHFRKKGMSVAESAAQARKWIMDYSTVAPSIRVARRYFAPFVTYQTKIIPILAEAIAKRPIQTYMMMSVPKMITEAALEHMDVSESEWQEWKANLPEYIKDNQTVALMPWKEKGRPVWRNLEYMVPWGGPMQLARARSVGDIQRGIGIGNPIVNIVFKVFADAKGDNPPRDPFTSREIYSRLDSPKIKLAKSAEWMANQFIGSAWSRHGALGKTVKALKGEKLRTGEPATLTKAAKEWVGIKDISPTREQSIRSKRWRLMQLKTALNRELKKPNVSPETRKRLTDAYIRMAKKILAGTPELTRSKPRKFRKVRIKKPRIAKPKKVRPVKL